METASGTGKYRKSPAVGKPNLIPTFLYIFAQILGFEIWDRDFNSGSLTNPNPESG